MKSQRDLLKSAGGAIIVRVDAQATLPSATERTTDSTKCIIRLLTFTPVPEHLLRPLLADRMLHITRAPGLTRQWSAFAQGADAVLVACSADPLAALVYALSAGSDTPVVVAVTEAHIKELPDVHAAGAFQCLRLPVTAADLAGLQVALRARFARHRVDASFGFVLDPVAREIRVGSRRVRLTQRECAIMDCLIGHSGRAIPAATLMGRVWSEEHPPSAGRRALDVHVCHLRRKLSSLGIGVGIRTVRNFGYVLAGLSSGTANDDSHFSTLS